MLARLLLYLLVAFAIGPSIGRVSLRIEHWGIRNGKSEYLWRPLSTLYEWPILYLGILWVQDSWSAVPVLTHIEVMLLVSPVWVVCELLKAKINIERNKSKAQGSPSRDA